MNLKSVKIFCMILAILSIFFAVSCKNEGSDIPDGMQLASVEGVPFKLFVPTNWTLNTSSGISGAYLSSKAGISVSADCVEAGDGETLDAFLSECIEKYQNELEDFEKIEQSNVVVDSREAKKLIFSAKYKGEEYKFMYAFVKSESDFVVFCYKAKSDYFDTYISDAESMLEVFKLSYSGDTVRPDEKDKKTPEGMKIASGDNVEYRLYVPEKWIVNSKNAIAGAYYSDDDRSNVSLTSYSPTQSTGLDDYVKSCEEAYEKIYNSFTLVSSETDKKLGERTARDNTYSFELDGKQYMQRQVICIYSDNIYSLVYTSSPEKFDLHREDVEKIIKEFTFR